MFRSAHKQGRLLLIALVLLATAAWAVAPRAIAQNDEVTVIPVIATFTKLQIDGAGDATISIGDTPSITITASPTLQDLINVSEGDGTLTVGFIEGTVLDAIGQADIQYNIVATSLDTINLSGSVNATVDRLSAESLTLGLTTLAEIEIDELDVQTLDAKLDFASTAHLSGRADTQTVEVLKGSSYDAAGLDTGSTAIDLSEVSSATVRVRETLSGSVASGSTLEYIGENPVVTVSTSSLGSIAALPFAPLPTPAATPVAAAPSEVSIDIRGFAFAPATATVAVGGTITWTNRDFLVHDVASLPADTLFHSPILAKGSSFSFTATEPGVIDYYCALHPSMVGQIAVVEQ